MVKKNCKAENGVSGGGDLVAKSWLTLCNCDPRNSLYLILVVGAPFLDFMSCLSVTFALKTKQNKTKKDNLVSKAQRSRIMPSTFSVNSPKNK